MREGAIIKGGLYLELLSSVDTVVFDKTGTLTLGNPEVILIMAADGHSEHDVLQTATVAEQRSENPSGKAIVKKATESQLEIPAPEEFKYVPGKGIECRVDHRRILVGNGAFLRDNNIVLNGAGSSADPSSEILVVRDGVHFGAIQIADTLRPEAKESVAVLHALGLRTVLLTGDAKSIAKEVGIDVIHAEVLPDQKSEVLKQLVSRGRKVAMVGERCASTNAGNSWNCNGFIRSIMLSVLRNDYIPIGTAPKQKCRDDRSV